MVNPEIPLAHIVLPVRDQLSLTASILEQRSQQGGWERCWIFDNGSTDGTDEYLRRVFQRDARFHPMRADGYGIYEMWSEGFHLARGRGAGHVAFLNNDLMLARETIDQLNVALSAAEDYWIAYPDYDRSTLQCWEPRSLRETHGTYRHGGMSGFCFMLKAAKVAWAPLVDPRLEWWCGDDDIAFEVEARGGKQVRVVGLGIDHLNEGTARHHDLGAQKAADMAACLAKWGR
jgi:glycosyltransferase involved in cell wall biosynthesis